MGELDEEYLYSSHGDNIAILKNEYGSSMFTMKQALRLGIGHVEFAMMCADGAIAASWCPRGGFLLSKEVSSKSL